MKGEMQMKKCAILIMLSIVGILFCSTIVFATGNLEYIISDETSSQKFSYVIKEDDTIEIVEYEGDAVTIDIPEQIEGVDVTSIADFAFGYDTHAYTVNVPSKVSYIGNGFCSDFERLDTIVVDSNNKSYSSKAGALYNKSKTTLIRVPMNKNSVSIDGNTETIVHDAFYSCNNLTMVNIPAKVGVIESGAFSYCKNLKKITVDEKNKFFVSIDDSLYNRDVTTLIRYSANYDIFDIPVTVSKIEGDACSGIEDLENDSNFLILPYYVTYVGKYAFWGCEKIEKIAILNKNCEIIEDVDNEEGGSHLSGASIVCGYVGSTAQEYADLYNLQFEEYVCEHVYQNFLTEPTCVLDGNNKAICSKCGNEKNTKINKLGHVGGTATCSKKAICTRCNQEYGELAENNHLNTEVRNKEDKTCTKNGYTGDKYCKDCNKLIAKGNIIVPSQHVWDDGVITKNPTPTQEGIKTYTCKVCFNQMQETIDKTKFEKQEINTAKVKGYKSSSLKKKAVSFSLKAKTSGKTRLVYKVTKYPPNAKKYITVSKKGKVTLKKGAKKGTYKITITAVRSEQYMKASKIVTIKIK